MRAVVMEQGRFRLGEVPDPDPAPDEVVVRVAGFSVNYGEVRDHAQNAADGTVPGWEAGGVVVATAADGSGPAEGTPVVTFGLTGGGWAQYRTVPVLGAAPIDPGSDAAAASTVVVAGGSALQAIRRLGSVVGRRVLVTGATGGVGRFAVQLARLAGAHPIALTRDPDGGASILEALGAREIHARVEDVVGPLHGVVDSIGGDVLVAAFDRLTDHGTLVTVGQSAGRDAILPASGLIGRTGGHDRTIASFFLPSTTSDLRPELTWLAARVEDGTLDPGIVRRETWEGIGAVTDAVLDTSLRGKAVLDVT